MREPALGQTPTIRYGSRVIDALYRLGLRCAYRLMCLYWRFGRVHTNGALVVLWHESRCLLIRNSYVSYFSLPGGYVKSGESATQAAVRELREEVGLRVNPEQLVFGREETHQWAGKTDHVVLFDLHVNAAPTVTIDNREVIAADFFTVEEALKLTLFPPLRRHLEQRQHAPA
jgi:8-oxo-dGTP diphosphatase